MLQKSFYRSISRRKMEGIYRPTTACGKMEVSFSKYIHHLGKIVLIRLLGRTA